MGSQQLGQRLQNMRKSSYTHRNSQNTLLLITNHTLYLAFLQELSFLTNPCSIVTRYLIDIDKVSMSEHGTITT